jgi:hypothetical protein
VTHPTLAVLSPTRATRLGEIAQPLAMDRGLAALLVVLSTLSTTCHFSVLCSARLAPVTYFLAWMPGEEFEPLCDLQVPLRSLATYGACRGAMPRCALLVVTRCASTAL